MSINISGGYRHGTSYYPQHLEYPSLGCTLGCGARLFSRPDLSGHGYSRGDPGPRSIKNPAVSEKTQSVDI